VHLSGSDSLNTAPGLCIYCRRSRWMYGLQHGCVCVYHTHACSAERSTCPLDRDGVIEACQSTDGWFHCSAERWSLLRIFSWLLPFFPSCSMELFRTSFRWITGRERPSL